jgi:hypothetical protein
MRDVRVGPITRVAAAATVLAIVGGTGCAREATLDLTAVDADAELDANLLASAADRSDAEAYRFEMEATTWAAMGDDEDDSLAMTVSTTGATDGVRQMSMTELGGFFEGAPGGPPPGFGDHDLTIETVVDGTMLYIRAPFFAAIGEMMDATGVPPSQRGPYDALGGSADGWVRINQAVMGGAEAEDLTDMGGEDPQTLLDLLREAAEPRPLGNDEVRGVPVEGFGATATFEDLLVADGIDRDGLEAELPPGVIDGPGGVDDMLDLEIPLEAWVDDDGLIRRFVMDLDFSAVLGTMPGDTAGQRASVRLELDFFDYGAEDIVIEVPTGAIDITEQMQDLAEFDPFPLGGDPTTT